MELTEDQNVRIYGTLCRHCDRDTFLPNEYEHTCVSYGYNVIKSKDDLSKISEKKINFIKRTKLAENKTFCICIDVY